VANNDQVKGYVSDECEKHARPTVSVKRVGWVCVFLSKAIVVENWLRRESLTLELLVVVGGRCVLIVSIGVSVDVCCLDDVCR